MNLYTIYITPETFKTIKELPGNIRQRVRKAIHDLSENPRPFDSKELDLSGVEIERETTAT